MHLGQEIDYNFYTGIQVRKAGIVISAVRYGVVNVEHYNKPIELKIITYYVLKLMIEFTFMNT